MSVTTPTVFSTPRIDTMKSAWALIHAQINALQLDFLPYLQEKLPRLQGNLILADQAFNEYLGRLLAMARNTDLDGIDRTRERVGADTSLSAERKAQALERVADRQTKKLAELKTGLLTSAQTLSRRVDDVMHITLELPDDTLETSLQQQLDALAGTRTELTGRLSEVAEDRRLLNETIKTFEQNDMLKNLQALLPTPETLEALALPNPKVALLQAGLAKLKILLGKISDSITYQELLDQRDRLSERYTELLTRSRGIDSQARALSGRLEQFSGIAGLNNARNVWVHEARKAPESLYAYLDTYLSSTAERLPNQRNVDELRDYLESFQGVWRTA